MDEHLAVEELESVSLHRARASKEEVALLKKMSLTRFEHLFELESFSRPPLSHLLPI